MKSITNSIVLMDLHKQGGSSPWAHNHMEVVVVADMEDDMELVVADLVAEEIEMEAADEESKNIMFKRKKGKEMTAHLPH